MFDSYFSIYFLMGFLPIVMLVYSLVPKRARWVVLLLASYAFFWMISNKLIIFILISTLITWAIGIKLGNIQAARDVATKQVERSERKALKARYKRKMLRWMWLGVAINFGLLIALKYLVFFASVAGSLFTLMGINMQAEVFYIGVPIGISFYTLMAASYLIDVYHEKTAADHNLGRIALFLSFFPQIMEGPICRYEQTAMQLMVGEPITREKLFKGALRIIWGFCKKIIIADRLNLVVKPVFADYTSYDGGIIALVAILYTIQLYCDFSGCIDICIGMGRIFGVKMPENFNHPFFSRTASEFWKRWHITLGSWLRDYIFYPVSLSKPLKSLTKRARKSMGNRFGPLVAGSITLFCVWFVNGLWHGAGSQYLFFGMYYFVIITLGGFAEQLMQSFCTKTGFNRACMPYKAFQLIRTLVVIFIGELFFRAEGLDAGLSMFGNMVSNFTLASFSNGTLLGIGMDVADFALVIVACAILLVVALVQERGTDISQWLWQHRMPLRWAVIYALIIAAIIFGSYGMDSMPLDPIYAQF